MRARLTHFAALRKQRAAVEAKARGRRRKTTGLSFLRSVPSYPLRSGFCLSPKAAPRAMPTAAPRGPKTELRLRTTLPRQAPVADTVAAMERSVSRFRAQRQRLSQTA